MITCADNPDTIIMNANLNTATNKDTATNKGEYTWLALGDSYTIGESVTEAERFAAQTISLLKNDSLRFKTPQYIATTGWTTLNLLEAIILQKPKGPFTIVTLLIGVNDQYQFRDTINYRKRFAECLQKAIALAGTPQHVFVLSIPDYSVTPFAENSDREQISKQINEFNIINREVTESYKISYTDITPSTLAMKNNKSLIANDGLHPSGKEYAKWAALLAAEIKKALK